MPVWIVLLGWLGFAALALAAVAMLLLALRERRPRPARITVAVFLPVLIVLTGLLLIDYPGREWVVLALLVLGLAAVLLLIAPFGAVPRMRIDQDKQQRIDERDAIFHRFYRLQSGTPQFEAYYREHPEHVEIDEKIRSLPKLAHPGGRTYHPMASAFTVATFDVLEGVTREIEWEPAPIEGRPVEATPEEFTGRVKGFARYLGADLVGTTKLNPAYVYSHVGRSPGKWGAPIELNHAWAIAIGVEMTHDMIRHAPDSATTTETSFKYFQAAKVAMILARWINVLGYEARAHVDGNYRVLCGPIAVDAGLGELGRLGLLINPTYGASLRLSAVTTNMPLTQDAPVHFGVQHFCEICRKCAANCPSASIDSGDKQMHNGVEKWRSEQESCYRYWRRQGTDCAICINVCPYSHPRTLLHDIVRWAIRRNAIARRVALWGDDLFYGRRPRNACRLPEWHAKTEP